MRAGHAYAEGAALHGRPPERHWVREVRSNWFWGVVLPVLALGPAWPTRGITLALFVGYAILGWKVARFLKKRGFSGREAKIGAFFTVLGKFPQMLGQVKYWWGRVQGKRSRLIEYKAEPPAPSAAVPEQRQDPAPEP